MKETCLWQKQKGLNVFSLFGSVNTIDVDWFWSECGKHFNKNYKDNELCPKCGKKIEWEDVENGN